MAEEEPVSIFIDALRTDVKKIIVARWDALFERIELKIKLSEHVITLKRRVQNEVGCPLSQQLLSLKDGTHLSETGKSLADYGVEAGCAIHLTDFRPLRKSWDQEQCPCKIEKTEHRGISLRQLNELLEFFGSRTLHDGTLGGWTETFKGSPDFGKPLTLRGINLHQANQWLIKPSSRPYKSSYVELISTSEEAQKPTWFASHCWSEAIHSFVMCVEEHQDRRNRETSVGDEAAIWVCAYANNQHNLGGEIGWDPKDSAFFKAIALCRGVLLILDEEASPFERIWCCFEESVVISDEKKLLDMATVVKDGPTRPLVIGDNVEVEKDGRMIQAVVTECIPSKSQYKVAELSERAEILLVSAKQVKVPEAVVLMEGLTLEEAAMEKKYAGRGWEVKRKREERFPMALVKNKGLSINIACANASVPIDRVRILNSIAGKNGEALDEEPNAEGEEYEIVNHGLSAMFAIAAWPRAVNARDQAFEEKVARSVQIDTHRKQLSLSFAGLDAHALADKDLEVIGRSLPPHLESLTFCLGLGNRRCFDTGYHQLIAGIPANLRCLNLDLSKGFNLTDDGVSALAGRLPGTLKELRLSLDNPNDKGLITDRSLEELADALRPGLESFSLSLQFLESVSELGVHYVVAAMPDSVQQLSMQLVGTPGRSVLPQSGQLQAVRKLQGGLREGMPLRYAPGERLQCIDHVAHVARTCPGALLTASKVVRDNLSLVLAGVLAASVAQPVHVQVGALCMVMSERLREELRKKLEDGGRLAEAELLRTWDLRENPQHGVVKVLPKPPPGVYEDRAGGTWQLAEDGRVVHTDAGKEVVYNLREQERSSAPVCFCYALLTEASSGGLASYAKYSQHAMIGGQYLFKDYSGKQQVYWKPADSVFKGLLDFCCEQAEASTSGPTGLQSTPRSTGYPDDPKVSAGTAGSKARKRLDQALQSAELLLTSAEEKSLDTRFLESFGRLAEPPELEVKSGKPGKDEQPQDAVQKAISMFKEFDTNGDLCISQEELMVGLKRMDPNITQAEVHKLHTTIDTHGDGYITMHEFMMWLCALNGGNDDKRQSDAAGEVEEGKREGHRDAIDMFGAGRMSEEAKDAISRVVNIFQQVDADGDGRVSAEELEKLGEQPALENFLKEVDVNHDGNVSFTELLEFRFGNGEEGSPRDKDKDKEGSPRDSEGEQKETETAGEGALRLAAQSVKALKQQHLADLRTYSSPPESVKMICEALCLLFNLKPPSYETANRELLSRRTNLVEEISNFDAGSVSKVVVDQVKARVSELDRVKLAPAKSGPRRISGVVGGAGETAAQVLGRWVLAAVDACDEYKALPEDKRPKRKKTGAIAAVGQDMQGSAPPSEGQEARAPEPVTFATLDVKQRKKCEKNLGVFIDNLDSKLNSIYKQRKMIPVVFGSASVCEAMREFCGKEKSWEMLDCTSLNSMARKKQALEDSRTAIVRALKEGSTLCVFTGTPSNVPNLKMIVKETKNKGFLPQAVFLHGGLNSNLVQKHIFQDDDGKPPGADTSLRVCVLVQYENGHRMTNLETELMEDRIPLFNQMESVRCFNDGDIEGMSL